MKPIIAVDPGNVESAYVVWDGTLHSFAKVPNDQLMDTLKAAAYTQCCVIEQIKSYGLSVGESIFETCVWTGRFMEAYGASHTHRIPRLKVKLHICNSPRANDSNIRTALIDRFGAPGTKKAPGMLYGVSKDVWAALALAVTWWDQNAAQRRAS